MIRSANREDAPAVGEIYNYYVENTSVTFEEALVSTDEMARRIEECLGGNLPWLVVEDNGKVVGFCYASKWKGRCAYRHSVEATIYLHTSACSRGWGTRLYTQLLAQLKSLGFHAVICGIALPNEASVALHEKFGMEKVAHFKEVGRKFERWADVGYWQCLLGAGSPVCNPITKDLCSTKIVPINDKPDEELMSLLLLADPDIHAVQRYLADAECIIAINGHEKLGVALLTVEDGACELKNIAVKPDLQGRGIGALLIEAVKERARALGAEYLLVGTGNSSLDELAFYQKSGFRMTGIKSGFFAAYNPPIIENGIRCLDMVILQARL